MLLERSGSLRLLASSRAYVVVAGIALALTGCASQNSTAQHASGAGMPAKSMPAPSQSHSDDFRQPWSPNYGPRPPIENTLPSHSPAPIEAGSTRIATMDADALIRHAVAQHEMRRP